MNVRELIYKLAALPQEAAVFIDLNDDARTENAQEITQVDTRTGPLGAVVVLSADWGKHGY